jgi:hypothetical protein
VQGINLHNNASGNTVQGNFGLKRRHGSWLGDGIFIENAPANTVGVRQRVSAT